MVDGCPVVGTIKKEVHDCELSAADSTASEASEEGDKMYQIFSQLTDFEKQVNEANACYESWEKRAREMREPRIPSLDTFDVPLMLSQAEYSMNHNSEVIVEDTEWHSCEVPHDASNANDIKNIEIFVSNTSHKPGRIVDVSQSLKRIEQEKRKKQYLEVHKVHLLLLLAHGMQVNRLVNASVADFASELYDLVANSYISMTEKDSLSLVKSIVDCYRENVKLGTKRNCTRAIKIKKGLKKQIIAREASCRRMFNVMLLTVLRFLCVRSRLVMHLDVVPKSAPISKPPSKGKINEINRPSTGERYRDVPLTTTEILKRKPEIQKMFQVTQLDGADADSQGEELPTKKVRMECATNKPRLWKLKSEPCPDLHNKQSRIEQNRAELSAPNILESGQRTVRMVSSKHFRKKPPAKQRSAGGKMVQSKVETNERKNISIEKPNLSKLIVHKAATIPTDSSKRKHRVPQLDTWIECFLEPEQRWSVVEAKIGDVDCMERVIDLIQDPPVYVFAFEADGTVVDVSERYRWRNETLALKQRVDKKWLKKALNSHRPAKGDLGFLVEQLEFRQLKYRAPMPTTIAQFKNHPSYCLPRDLQKFQGIYPPDAPPLGYIHGEPVYARECVHTLHSREVWLRHAKVIRMLEQPYKIVKSKLRREQTNLELFGYWQTEDYIPPEPIDGIVPRNAYGNIEIFKDCMLPKGTVHLKQYGLSNICRKLGIDYAVAVVGFGVHAGGNHPVFDGIVICEEHRDRLLEAWETHQEESAQKKLEKKRQMVLNNWVKLVKGLLVRRKLKNKYNFDGM
uniref:Rad4 beta-hairpin domain-containing protein n=1 Tax=Anopheles atroparvus TaxID=41427 RepID=A0AAG5CY39_ANOAO